MNALKRGRTWQVLLSLVLLCFFAASALMVVIFGARVYRGTVAGSAENFSRRTAVSYLAEKIRQADQEGAISIAPMDGGEALVLRQTAGAEEYQTWIYLYEGELCEALIPAGNAVQPQSGQKILPLSELHFTELGNSLLKITAVSAEGVSTDLMLQIHCS